MSNLKKTEDTSISNSSFHNNTEKLDLMFFIALLFHTLSLMFLLTLIQSLEPFLKQISLMAIAQAVLSFMGISLTALLTSAGFLKIQPNFVEERKINSSRIITRSRHNLLGEDISWVATGIFIQILLYLIFGTYSSAQLQSLQGEGLFPFLLAFNAGISEEIFFSLFLSSAMLTLGKSKTHLFFSTALISTSFMLLHIVVYGSDTNALMFLLILRALYFLIYYKTRRVSIPIILHCLNNLLFINLIFIP